MADGLAVATANACGTTITMNAAYIGLNTGDPGSAGTANTSSTVTRESVTWAAASGGTISASNQPEWTSWAGSNGESVTDLSFWSASSSGTFEFSAPLSAGVTMDTGDSLTLTSISITIPTAS